MCHCLLNTAGTDYFCFNYRKVYSILMLQLVVTTSVIALFSFHEPTKNWVRRKPAVFYSSVGVMFVCLICMACCTSVRRKAPMNFIFLGLFTLAESYMLGCMAANFGKDEVMSCSISERRCEKALDKNSFFHCSSYFAGCHGCRDYCCGVLWAHPLRASNQVGLHRPWRSFVRGRHHSLRLWNCGCLHSWQDCKHCLCVLWSVPVFGEFGKKGYRNI